MGLKVIREINLTITDFLDVTLNLGYGSYKPYRKPNERLAYINTASCHPPITFKNLVMGVTKRVSSLSSNQKTLT